MKRLIRKVVPTSAIEQYKQFREAVNRRFIIFFARSRFTARLYYFFFSSQFSREQHAVLRGRVRYYRSLQQIGRSSALLRRNTHRLEKGLIMQPRRPVFAEGYILETVQCYERAMAAKALCSEEKKWASDVLTEYFSVVADTPIIAKARDMFAHAQVPTANAALERSVPKARSSYPALSVSTEQLGSLFKRRRSVRWFQPTPVEPEKLSKAVNLASLAPSACNRQPYEFYVINDASLAPEIARCAMGTVGFAENIPCIVAVVGNLDAYPAERDRHCIYIDGSLAAMQFMLAVETLGLASCPINWPDIDVREKMLARKLALTVDQRPIMLIAVGYADSEGGVPFSQKKSDQLLIRNITKLF